MSRIAPHPHRTEQPLLGHNLPPEFDPFIGREEERREIHTSLDQPTTRLVTLLGMGGVGKSRLAIAVAQERLHRYPDGVWLVELAEMRPGKLEQATEMAVAIAAALHLPWREGTNPATYLIGHLVGRRMLLLLDGVERLAAQGLPFLLSVTKDCLGVDLLATSRDAPPPGLGRTFPLAGLSYPPSDNDNDNDNDKRLWEAVELLTVRRAQYCWAPLTRADQRAIRRICRLVEGLPLAIELAAALTGEMSLPAIAAALEEGLEILSSPLRDAPARQHSLAAALADSWQRLTQELQDCLARLATLDGTFNGDTARRVAWATPGQLAALRDASLLAHCSESGRYQLHPAVRAVVSGVGSRPPLPPRSA